MAYKFFNKDYLLARLSSMALFWRVRYRFNRLNFKLLRFQFSFRGRISVSNLKIECLYWRALLRGSILPIILAVGLGLMLCFFDKILSELSSFGVNWVDYNSIRSLLLHRLTNKDIENVYVQMLSVIAGVTGVFLGLYFTTVSTVVSSSYLSTPGYVRELILRDRLGNKYVKFIAFLTALSIVLLAFDIVGVKPLYLAIPLLAIASCLAIFAFVNLGIRMFFLSDPTLFFDNLSMELMKWVRQATARGYQWQNSVFQNHYRKQALKTIKTLAALVEISNEKDELKDKSHSILIKKLLALTSEYYDYKHLIPPNSLWYDKKLQHRQWYLSGSTEIEMATQTGTKLSPGEVPDTTWLEDYLLSIVFKALENSINAGDFQQSYSIMVSLQNFFGSFGKNWTIEDGIRWHDKFSKCIMEGLTKSRGLSGETQEAYIVAIIDLLAGLPTSIELGFIKAVNELDIDRMRKKLMRMKWHKQNSPYIISLPPSVTRELEGIRDGAIFERKANASHKTQNWYVSEWVFNDLEVAIFEQWKSFMEFIEDWYKEAGKALYNAKMYKQSAAVYARAIEQAWKLDVHIENIKKASESLSKGDKVSSFIKQAKWNWDEEHERIASFRGMAIEGQAGLIMHLWDTSKSSHDIPDFFGGAVHYTGEACYEALFAGDSDKFRRLFRHYFVGVLGILQSLKSQVSDLKTPSTSIWVSEPVLDLYNISGYACIFAEYYNQPEIWNECKCVWNTFLRENADIMQLFAAISNRYQASGGVITPRCNLRSRWEQKLTNLLSSLPRRQPSDTYARPLVEHTSELIRNIAPWNDGVPFMIVNAIDVFTVKYLTLIQSSKVRFEVDEDKVTHINGRR